MQLVSQSDIILNLLKLLSEFNFINHLFCFARILISRSHSIFERWVYFLLSSIDNILEPLTNLDHGFLYINSFLL